MFSGTVKNLKEFGYPSCNSQNILTDRVYKEFFRSMLRDNLGKMGQEVDAEINKLLAEIGASKPQNQKA
jgi:hypothetical protein